MKIDKLDILNFGGITDKSLEFKDGTNVLLGNNEAGKSTAIAAISSLLFLTTSPKRDIKSKRTIQRYIPLGSKSCSAVLNFSVNDGHYSIEKSWGANESILLKCNDNTVISDITDAEMKIESLIGISRLAGESLVFAPQTEFKNTIEKIRADGAKDVADFLNRAVIDLGGVSLQKLKERLLNECDLLTSKWDMKLMLPSGGKTLDNKYVRGNGLIVEAYFTREQAKRELTAAEAEERNIELCTEKLNTLGKQLDDISKRLTDANTLSQSALIIAEKEKELTTARDKLSRYDRDADAWQVLDKSEHAIRREIEETDTQITELLSSLAAAEKYERAQRARSDVEQYDALKSELDELSAKLKQLPKITDAELDELICLEQTQIGLCAKCETGSIAAHIKKKDGVNVYTTVDFEKEQANAGNDISAGGYIKFRIDDLAEIEVQLGDTDYAQLKTELAVNEALYTSACKKLGVDNSSTARKIKQAYEQVESKSASVRSQLDRLNNASPIDELRKLVAEAVSPCDKASVSAELENAKDVHAQKALLLDQAREKLTALEHEYDSFIHLLSLKNDAAMSLIPIENEYNSLCNSVKAGNAEEIISTVHRLEAEKNDISAQYEATMRDYNSCDTSVSSDVLSDKIDEYDRQFHTLTEKAQSIDKIILAFDTALDDVRKMTYTGLEDTFSRYLLRLTADRYSAHDIDDSLDFTLSTAKREIPYSLLSSGTTDCVALAFRLALADCVLPDGLCVLDDCLVDMDAQRRGRAAELLGEFSLHHQLIFATCSADTARLLGGNIINM